MEIKELDRILYYSNRFSKEKKSYNKRAFFDSYIRFLDWAISYFRSEIGSKTYSIDTLVSTIFNTNAVSEKQFARQMIQYVYVANMFLEKLRSNADIRNSGNYLKSFWMMVADIEELIIANEYIRKKSTLYSIIPRLGVRDSLSAFDLKQTINQIIYMPEANSVDILDFRNIQPCAVVIIRQAIELIGRNIIGYHNICDASGNVVKQMTQISWKFLKEKSGKSPWTVLTPLQLSNIEKLNKWANAHVHNPWIQKTYIRAFGLEVIWTLMKPVSAGVKCHDGIIHNSTQFGDFRINNYRNLQLDFEQYVQAKKPGAVVKWMDLKDVGAYVLSL